MLVVVVDDQKPETVAMLQALYSRSPMSVVKHLDDVRARGADKFMATYYVGYGHKSIGDCGSTSIFIENVSMLAAKAIQDTPLYNGQEASTRYLDMTQQEVLNPLGSIEGKIVQDRWMGLYADALQKMVIMLKEKFPRKEGEKEIVWEKAIKAKAFDIARGLLPAGATTYVSWHTNLRQAHDHLKELRNHPLQEIKNIAQQVEASLITKYPSSFCHKVYPDEEIYLQKSLRHFGYFDNVVSDFSAKSSFDLVGLAKFSELLASRPPKTELHQRLRQFGNITFKFWLDFGSYRDLQRQRSAVQEMPLLTVRHGFYQWYMDHMPEFAADIEKQVEAINRLDADEVTKQYYVAMGFSVPVSITCSLPSAVYIAELRSSTTVHPTLRVIAQKMGAALLEAVPGLALHCDNSPDQWSIKRGSQDIIKRDNT